MERSKKVVILGIISILVIGIAISFAYWQMVFQQNSTNIVTTDCFKVTFRDGDAIHLADAYPVSDEEGMKNVPYDFTITNICNSSAFYQINLETLVSEGRQLPEKYVKANITEDTTSKVTTKLLEDLKVEPVIQGATDSYKLLTGELNPNEEKVFHLRLWMHSEVTSHGEDSMNATYQGRVSVVTSYIRMYKEEILNGTDPVLRSDLIPVTIDASGEVKKADISKEWYKYEDKVWANAVILEDESIVYENEEVIPEDNIESYFVWIPRYRYQIFNGGNYDALVETVENNEQTINVQFENKEQQSSNGSTKGEWLTHPAFTSFDVNGIWVGKFETGYKGATSAQEAEQNINDIEKIQIKPDVYSWRMVQMVNIHLNSYNYRRKLESHAMKNTEWGAVAYLSHSRYGLNGSVRMNNNSDYMTGYAATSEPTCGHVSANTSCNSYGTSEDVTVPYNTALGSLASTTGNISGIYDMSGGAWDYVMAVMVNQDGIPYSGRSNTYLSFYHSYEHSGFNGPYGFTEGSYDQGISFPDAKYYDKYAYGTSVTDYSRRILGDATGEMGPFVKNEAWKVDNESKNGSWYSDSSWALIKDFPWYIRGGTFDIGVETGIFSSYKTTGTASKWDAYRIVLAI